MLPYLFGKQFRFTLLCHAACEAPLVLPLGGFTYGEKCLFLANDWHASLVPLYVHKISDLVIFSDAYFDLSLNARHLNVLLLVTFLTSLQ